jgi:hypothetical protein
MARLNEAAHRILRRALEQHGRRQAIAEVQREMVQRRWEKLRHASGSPATYADLRDTVSDAFPDFPERPLRRAAKANQGPGVLAWMGWGAVGLAGLGGVVWVLNLPYPPVRYAVADKAPLLLLPSFISMDHHYRGAIAAVEQADQYVNEATSAADLEQGAAQVTIAQDHLDHLPVWFLGYYPRAYCTLFGCTWRFTLDEFEGARKSVARMEAQIFQEKNAQTALTEALGAIEAARARYDQTPTGSEALGAIRDWRSGLDRLREIPTQTLAGEQAQLKLEASARDFEETVGAAADQERSVNAVVVAKGYALEATKLVQAAPHPVAVWQQAQAMMDRAIAELNAVQREDADYVSAQEKRAEYEAVRSAWEIRKQAETDATRQFQQIEREISQWRDRASRQPNDPALVAQLEDLLDDLKSIPAGTTVSDPAQDLAKYAGDRLASLR